MNFKLNMHLLCLLLLLPLASKAQVTIGNTEPPIKGALLQLKNLEAQSAGGSNANKGLILPKVKITDLSVLKMTDDTNVQPIIGDEKTKHTGMMVFNVNDDRCSDKQIYKGVYIWTGEKWEGIALNTKQLLNFSLNVDKLSFDLPSGKDLRTLAKQTAAITWLPTSASLDWTITAPTSNPNVDFTVAPLPSKLQTGGTLAFEMTPDEMVINSASPWSSKESEVTLLLKCAGEIGESKIIKINQTNYALQVNNLFASSSIIATAGTGVDNTIVVKGNAKWQPSFTTNGFFANTNIANNTASNTDIKDGTTFDQNFTFTTDASKKFLTESVAFKDTESTKRFNDISVSVLNCNKSNTTTGMNFTKKEYHLPSGNDLRPYVAQNLAVNWLPTDKTLKYVEEAVIDGGVTFTTPLPPSPISEMPLNFSLLGTKIKNTAYRTNPFVKKTSHLIFTNICGDIDTVVIDQTYYAALVRTMTYKYIDGSPEVTDSKARVPVWLYGDSYSQAFAITSSAKLKVSKDTPGAYDIMTGMTATPGDPYTLAPLIVGGDINGITEPNPSITYRYQRIDFKNIQNLNIPKYTVLPLAKVEDAGNGGVKRFNDVLVEAIVCSGPEVGPLGANVYEYTDPRDNQKYMVGYFGSAGWWMLENMRATTYANGATPPVPYQYEDGSTKYFMYPKTPLDPTLYNLDPKLGVSYNYLAASNGENPGGVDQGYGSTTEAAQPHVQGICPNGFHLPTDREWNELEAENYNNPHLYSSVTSSEMNPVVWQDSWNTGSGRGEGWPGHNGVMTSLCLPYGDNTSVFALGRSKSSRQGGFNAIMAGIGEANWASTAAYWASSTGKVSVGSYYRDAAYYRWFSSVGRTVIRGRYQKQVYLSVRCKRN